MNDGLPYCEGFSPVEGRNKFQEIKVLDCKLPNLSYETTLEKEVITVLFTFTTQSALGRTLNLPLL